MHDQEFYCLHSEVCKILANPKRQMILDELRNGETTVNEIVKRTGISQANLSQHLSIMRARGILNARRDGVRVYYSISNPKIIKAFDLISDVLTESLGEKSHTVKKAVSKK